MSDLEHAAQRCPMVVALTGGIASGKTLVSDSFGELGVDVFDTDLIARELTEPGTDTLDQIRLRFGDDILGGDGRLDRRKLRNIIFSNPGAQDALEAILHPAIFLRLNQRIRQSTAPYCIAVVPLLAETGVPDFVDRVLLVDVDESIQVDRLMARDVVSEADAKAALGAQADRQVRREIADDTILNNGTVDALKQQVAELHSRYLRMAVESKNHG